MEKFEIYCESGSGGPARGFLGEDLCHACDVAELKALLSECDADEVKKLRRIPGLPAHAYLRNRGQAWRTQGTL
jgi:hypothetical protein